MKGYSMKNEDGDIITGSGVRTPPPRTTIQPTGLVEFEEFLRTRLTARNANLAEATIQTRLRAVKMFTTRVNLWDSNEVQRYIDSAP